uniref:Uncharacterized protein n=1 Tax=Rhizophora mucronata TaxID=61149 RepID=A0A2P2N673_RHIMU
MEPPNRGQTVKVNSLQVRGETKSMLYFCNRNVYQL